MPILLNLLVGAAAALMAQPGADTFGPAAFFIGETAGEGVLTHRDGSVDDTFRVRSHGDIDEGGCLVVDQRVMFEEGEDRTRDWRLCPEGEGAFAGTLSEASGKVRAEIEGDVITLRYGIAGKPFVRMEQVLTREGETLDNRGTVRFFGFTVRRLEETIYRLEDAPDSVRALPKP